MRISLERSILIVADQFLQDLFKKYGKNPVPTDDDGGGTWYPQACRFLKFVITLTHIIAKKKHHYREPTIQYIKKQN
jgi:putative transposase